MDESSEVYGTLFDSLCRSERVSKIDDKIQILIGEGYPVLDMLYWTFNNFDSTNIRFLNFINAIAKRAHLENIKKRYSGATYFKIRYDSVVLNQI